MNDDNQVRVWDPLVRIFHWTLVAAFATAWLSGDEAELVHVWVGHLVVGLVLVRLVWGFIGPRYARFADFVRGPRTVVSYLREELRFRAPRHLGHNPAGGAMIVALLGALLLSAATGLATFGAEGHGLLAGWLGHLGKDAAHDLEEVHELFANLTLVLVFAHVAGVLLGSLAHRENLVRSMFTGTKRA